MHIRKNSGGGWEFVDDPTYNRRITAWSIIDLDGPAAGTGAVLGFREVQGTVGNCAGGYTPWGTVLSAEENFQDYNPSAEKGGYGWGKDGGNDGRYFIDEHYGWIVEIDPFDKNARPVKHTALGRFRHENATTTLSKSGKVVVYTGYDRADWPVFKFISSGVYNPADRAGAKKLLSSGTLYAADFATGKWVEISDRNSRITTQYKSLEAILVNAGEAAILAGATRCDRPEDMKINPIDGGIYIAMTNNSGHGNYHGQITRIFEAGNDYESLEFSWDIFASGGPQARSNFSSPDNLIFDSKGNLWVFVDVSSSVAGTGIYKTMGNNGIYVIPSVGEYAGIAYRFASGPVQCENTGPSWTPDQKTLFFSVQHPGEESTSLDKLTSHWPEGGSAVPKSAVVAVRGF
jgi:secreted PhoX family phosphatase